MNKLSDTQNITVRVSPEADGTRPIRSLNEAPQDNSDQVRQQSRRLGGTSQDVIVPANRLKKEFSEIVKTLEESLTPAPSAKPGLRVETVKVGMTFTGKGKLVLVGELGVKAAVEVTFRWD